MHDAPWKAKTCRMTDTGNTFCPITDSAFISVTVIVQLLLSGNCHLFLQCLSSCAFHVYYSDYSCYGSDSVPVDVGSSRSRSQRIARNQYIFGEVAPCQHSSKGKVWPKQVPCADTDGLPADATRKEAEPAQLPSTLNLPLKAV